MLTGFDILFRFRAARLLEHRIQFILSDMALKASTGFGFGTLHFKLALVTCARRSNIFIMLALFKKLAPFQGLAGRTGKSVSFGIVGKSFFGKDTFFGAGPFLSLLQR